MRALRSTIARSRSSIAQRRPETWLRVSMAFFPAITDKNLNCYYIQQTLESKRRFRRCDCIFEEHTHADRQILVHHHQQPARALTTMSRPECLSRCSVDA